MDEKFMQVHSFGNVLQNRCSQKFRNIHMNTYVLESHFNKVAMTWPSHPLVVELIFLWTRFFWKSLLYGIRSTKHKNTTSVSFFKKYLSRLGLVISHLNKDEFIYNFIAINPVFSLHIYHVKRRFRLSACITSSNSGKSYWVITAPLSS